MISCKPILIDRRNFEILKPIIIQAMQNCAVCGFDLETHNENAHEGIKTFRKEEDTKAFDWRQKVITGFSIYPELNEPQPIAYYFNIEQADVENRLTWAEVKPILDAKAPSAAFIAHNASYEITVTANSQGYFLPDIICTMQMAVSAWGPDEYEHSDYINQHFGAMKELFPDASRLFADVIPKEGKDNLTPAQAELLYKVTGKQSFSTFSYNGICNGISYGYGLKKLVQKFFNFKMVTFEEVLGTKKHMGELTGEEVCSYGADDAYWAVKLFFKIYEYMRKNCPETIPTFFAQENPMVYVYSQIKQEGLRVNVAAIEMRRMQERAAFAQKIREIKAIGKSLLPFPQPLNERLAKYDKWYRDKGQQYRDRLEQWLLSPDSPDDFTQACQVSSPVSNAWAGSKCTGISIGHYFQSRLLMYDLTGYDPIIYKGKVQSDGETRGELKDKIEKGHGKTDPRYRLITLMGELASVEQRMKLYLTPYLLLTDPETGCMYPEVSSMLATRRMACSNPNAQQLAKRGESTYVRGFYLPDSEDEVLVSLDWSQIELVIIGELSGDAEFAKAYGQLPYQDLHVGSTVSGLQVLIPELTLDYFKSLARMPDDQAHTVNPKLLTNTKGEIMTPAKAYKYWRTELGKKINFGYWYSGALSDVAAFMGWTVDQMWAATDIIRKRFPQAEAWRVGTIAEARQNGFVMLPDGHRRTRWEATDEWMSMNRKMVEPYGDQGAVGVVRFAEMWMKDIRSRAGNQVVNAKVQGTSATLTKRSILAINKALKETGIRARFKMPIHDELVFSVHKDDVVAFIRLAKSIMINHPDIIKTLKVDCTASVGYTFEPYDAKKAPLGQIELDECPNLAFIDPASYGKKLNDNQIQQVVDYIVRRAA